MTRFARAKGSKSSNERKPEEATSWSEMKNIMVLKKSSQPEKFISKQEVKIDEPKPKEWASLNDDFGKSLSLLKQDLVKKNKKSNNSNSNRDNEAQTKKKKGKKTQNLNKCENENFAKSKSLEISVSNQLNENMAKKKNKRKLTKVDMDPEIISSIKKKKLLKTEEVISGVEQKRESKDDNKDKSNKKFQKIKKIMKQNYFKQEVKENFQSKITNKNYISRESKKQFKGKQIFKNKSLEKRKSVVEELVINGEKIPIVKFQGFYITLEDSERLIKLRNEMKEKKIPKAKLEAVIKLERRRAEKALSRLKKSVCFHCRGHGHLLSNCPSLLEKENTNIGICYKCGSTEHSVAECKVVRGSNYQFAECFICKEQGHIARQCPDNPRGLYPQGGACRECGDVTHLRKDCPQIQIQKAEEMVTVGLRNDRDLECLDEEITNKKKYSEKKVKKSNVKF